MSGPHPLQWAALSNLYNEVVQSIVERRISIEDATVSMTSLLKGERPVGHYSPQWYVMPHRQRELLSRYNNLFGWGLNDQEISRPLPCKVQPEKTSEVLLLTVHLPEKDGLSSAQRTFMELVFAIETVYHELGYRFEVDDVLRHDVLNLSHAFDKGVPGVRWKWYEPEAHRGGDVSTTDLWPEIGVWFAAYEVLSALLFFPEYGIRLGTMDVPAVELSGYSFRHPDKNRMGWHVPFASAGKGNNVVTLEAERATRRNIDVARPTIRGAGL